MKKRKYGLPIASVVACMVSATFANAGPIRDRINDLEWCRDQYPRYPLLKRLIPDDCAKAETHDSYSSK